jgi:hypothetical protein
LLLEKVMKGIATTIMRRSALLCMFSAPALFAQGAVSGQVTLLERAG